MRRFLTAALTLGALTAGVLGATTPAHAMKRANPYRTAVNADAWSAIRGQLSKEGAWWLAQADTTGSDHVTEHRTNQPHLRPDTENVVHVYTSQQLKAALIPGVDEAGNPLLDEDGEPFPRIAALGVHMALTEAEQTAISTALDTEQLTYLELHAGATLPTVTIGTVHVHNGGTITTVNGGWAIVYAGGTVTTAIGGRVNAATGGSVNVATGGTVNGVTR